MTAVVVLGAVLTSGVLLLGAVDRTGADDVAGTVLVGAVLDGAALVGALVDTGTDVDGIVVDDGMDDGLDDGGAEDAVVEPSEGGVVLLDAESVGEVGDVGEVGEVSEVDGDVVVDPEVDVSDPWVVVVSELGVFSTTGTGSQVSGDEGRAGNGSPGGNVAAGFCSTTL